MDYPIINTPEFNNWETRVTTRLRLEEPIPERTLEALRLYVNERIPTGGFLRACLENDFTVAVCAADNENLRSIVRLAKWMYVNLPSACWGSPECVDAWLRGEGKGELEDKT